jgi:hypothetical protein
MAVATPRRALHTIPTMRAFDCGRAALRDDSGLIIAVLFHITDLPPSSQTSWS